MAEASHASDVDALGEPSPLVGILRHPMYQEMLSLDVGDSAQVHAAFLVYMDLVEARQWKEVSATKCPELQSVLLEGREKDDAPRHTVLPLPVHRSLSHRSVRVVLDRGFPMLLCAVASDSSLVYQRFTDGLVTPDPPAEPGQDRGRRQHRKRHHQR